MKKYAIYIGILAIGLLLGWLLFSNSSNNEKTHNHDDISQSNQMWTCSMHPQILQPESGDCPICGMDLVPVETNEDGLTANQFKLTANAMALANVQTLIIGNIDKVDNSILLSGKIGINMDEIATQPAHFDGRVEKLFITSRGEKVEKRQAIGVVYSPELVNAQQELITAYKIRESQPKLYEAVRNKFKNWKIDESVLDEVLKTGKVKTQFTIHSHVSGIVSEINTTVGSHILDGHPIFKVTDLSTVWANFDIYENQVNMFHNGQNILINSNINPGKKIKGKVSFIDPILDSKTRTVKLRVILNNKNDELKPGMFVEGRINIVRSDNKGVINIPSTAVLWTGERSVVYIKTKSEEPVFEMRSISIGNKRGDQYEVKNGLNDGDEIVTNGAFTLDAAAQLQGKKSMMNKEGRKTITGHSGHHGMREATSKPNDDLTILNPRIKVSANFQNQLKTVFNDYINLKDALIEDDSNKVVEESKKFLENLNQIDMKLLTVNKAHSLWMKLKKEIESSGNLISTTTDIKEQRNYFKHLSSNLTSAIQIFGINEKVYNQFCPMADNDKGAYWLSKEEIVLNPYFGKAMITCGEVKQIIE